MAARALSNRTSTANTLLYSLGWCSFNQTVGAVPVVVVNRPLTTDSADTATSDEKSINVDRRPAKAPATAWGGRRDDFLPAFFSDPWDNPGRTLSQVLNFMDQFMDVPLGGRGVLRTRWNAREDDKSLYLKVEMPGLSKDDVKVWVEGTTLVIKGEKDEENRTVTGNAEDDITAEKNQGKGKERERQRYSSRIEIPEKGYKLDQIKAEMKHGVLRVVIPKVHEEERGDVIEVRIDG